MTWIRDGSQVNRSTQVTGGSLFDGGGEAIVGSGSCEGQMYRVALAVIERLPGNYFYTVTNDDTPTPIQSAMFVLEGLWPCVYNDYRDTFPYQ